MDVGVAEFQDWEMLPSNSTSDSAGNSVSFHEIGTETDSGGLVQPNYFSIDSQNRRMSTITGADGSEESSEESDNPSWIEPGSENQFLRKNSGEFWSDSGSELSEDCKFGEVWVKAGLGIVDNSKLQVGFEGIEELGSGGERSEVRKFEVKNEVGIVENSKIQVGFEENQENGSVEGERRSEITELEIRKAGKQKKRRIVWWKVPVELLKYCVFRVSPVWTFSVAAAMLGFVILVRRLYWMKKKSRGLELKVTVDDKKVSQFMSRAARLNEAFSVVKRAPMIRPQLPAAGVTPWPVMSLR